MRIQLALSIACLLLAGNTAMATPITFSLTSSLLTTAPGGTVTFFATLTETGGSTTFLNGDTLNLAAPLLADDTPFFINFPPSLSPLQSVTAAIFSVTVPIATSPGPYSGSFAVLGGSSPAVFNTLGTQPFTVSVLPPSAVPEPGEAVLLLLSVGATLVWRTRKGRGYGPFL